jgi:hypothetical protein
MKNHLRKLLHLQNLHQMMMNGNLFKIRLLPYFKLFFN